MPFHFRPMPARDQREHHQVTTPLELFFDLVAVIAIAAVTAAYHHLDAVVPLSLTGVTA